MTFDELLALVSSGDCPDICVDSRLVKDGDIFVAIKGTVYDGHDFIDQAITNGAKYIVTQNPKTRIEHRESSIEYHPFTRDGKPAIGSPCGGR